MTMAHRRGIADRLVFLDGVEYRDLTTILQEADLTLFTSHQETFGLGIIESLACGTPVVGPDWIIPTAEILRELPGARATAKRPEAFVEAAGELLEAQPDRERIARKARRRYGNLSVAERFLELLRPLRQEKAKQSELVNQIDWKALYRDQGSLL